MSASPADRQPSASGATPATRIVARAVHPGASRPFWSVMITHYNRTTYLARALRSVLAQDPGPEQMEIVVVDDASTAADPEPIIRSVAPDRVRLFRRAERGGLAATWNSCVRIAQGSWVHLLHDDDFVLPGFYRALRRGAEADPRIGAAFCRHRYVDEEEVCRGLSPLERSAPGVLEEWIERIAVSQRIQCASIVVRREVYEQLGGFRPELCFALDWDMWKRIACRFPVWYEPQPLAGYRVHAGSETARLRQAGGTHADVLRSIEAARGYLPARSAERLTRAARERYGAQLVGAACRCMRAGELHRAAHWLRLAAGATSPARVGMQLLKRLGTLGMRTVGPRARLDSLPQGPTLTEQG